ncbi:hypothetical protein [Acidaminobacter hydrogenoformans]|uniref:Uncharacterized protein n=1 Tax=Acidaminobacter hydrogenoformans DSM 2784 TaxID=1120920 RepID=A0A1G5RTC1_9FIRM|nr:hypothetical protein [Acidaminobacter hydrogenoformans]SCZ77000.1 hypothetical protein SAMN03080599_00513 [Acidaminobacter hydrogenoformans DSM 2784]
MLNHLTAMTLLLLGASVIGYLFSALKETMDFKRAVVRFKSRKVTQSVIDQYDVKIFKLGGKRVNIGDEVKIVLDNEEQLKGFVLGAKKKLNALAVITELDEIVELNIRQIRKLRIVTKYGRLF